MGTFDTASESTGYQFPLFAETTDSDGNANTAYSPIDYADDNILFQLQIDNPVTSGDAATPARDGLYAIARATLNWAEATDGSGVESRTYTNTYTWNPITISNSDVTISDTAVPVDLAPTADYDISTDNETVEDASAETAVYPCTTDQWTYAADDAATSTVDESIPNCEESWKIGNYGWTCVKLTGKFQRLMAADSSTDDLCDFTIDYVSHTMKVQIGAMSENSETNYVRFEQTVDLNQFLAAKTTSASGAEFLTSTLVVSLIGLYAFFF